MSLTSKVPHSTAKMRVLNLLLAMLAAATATATVHSPTYEDPGSSCAPLIAVTACTGEAGRRVLAALREVHPADRVRCIVRAGTTKPLDQLSDLEGVHHVDFMDTSSLREALHGCDSAYLNTPPSLDVLAMRTAIADACKSVSTLRHVVILGEAESISWYGLAKYWDDHLAGIDAIQRTGIPVTVINPNLFSEGFVTHFGNQQQVVTGDYFSRVGTEPNAYTSLEDLGEVAAKILVEGPSKHGWRKYHLVSSVMDGYEVAEAMTSAIGRPIEYRPITSGEFAAGLTEAGVPEVFVDGYRVVMERAEKGYFARGDRGQLEELLGRPPKSAEEVLREMKQHFDKKATTERATNK